MWASSSRFSPVILHLLEERKRKYCYVCLNFVLSFEISIFNLNYVGEHIKKIFILIMEVYNTSYIYSYRLQLTSLKLKLPSQND